MPLSHLSHITRRYPSLLHALHTLAASLLLEPPTPHHITPTHHPHAHAPRRTRPAHTLKHTHTHAPTYAHTYIHVCTRACRPEIVPKAGTLPVPRSFHKMIAVGADIYVYGGCAAKGRLADLHHFDTRTATWSQVVTRDSTVDTHPHPPASTQLCLLLARPVRVEHTWIPNPQCFAARSAPGSYARARRRWVLRGRGGRCFVRSRRIHGRRGLHITCSPINHAITHHPSITRGSCPRDPRPHAECIGPALRNPPPPGMH